MNDLFDLLGRIPAPLYVLITAVVTFALQRLAGRGERAATTDQSSSQATLNRAQLVQTLQSTINQMGGQLTAQRAKQDAQDVELRRLHRRVSTLEDQLREARRAAAAAEHRSEESDRAKGVVDERMAALTIELHATQADLAATTEKLGISEMARKRLQLRVDELEDQIDDLRQKLGAAGAPLKQIEVPPLGAADEGHEERQS